MEAASILFAIVRMAGLDLIVRLPTQDQRLEIIRLHCLPKLRQ